MLKTDCFIQIVNNHIIASISANLDEDGLMSLSRDILQAANREQVHGVIINMSAVSILGSHGFSILRNLSHAVELMGKAVVFVGFQPGVIVALIDLDIDFTDVLAAATTEDAFDLLADRPSRFTHQLEEIEDLDDIESEISNV